MAETSGLPHTSSHRDGCAKGSLWKRLLGGGLDFSKGLGIPYTTNKLCSDTRSCMSMLRNKTQKRWSGGVGGNCRDRLVPREVLRDKFGSTRRKWKLGNCQGRKVPTTRVWQIKTEPSRQPALVKRQGLHAYLLEENWHISSRGAWVKPAF